MVLVNFFYEDSAVFSLEKKEVRVWLKKFIQKEEKKLGCLNFIFCSDKHLLEINKKFLNHTTLTDVISFDFSESKKTIEGDVYISTDRVKENAKKYSVSFKKELLRTVVHGVLHLIGYKDKGEKEKKIMFLKEQTFLKMFSSGKSSTWNKKNNV